MFGENDQMPFSCKNINISPFPKLIGKMPLFWNLIFGQSVIANRKKKKYIYIYIIIIINSGTRAQWSWVLCNFLKPYSGILKHASFFLKSDRFLGAL